ncbi:slipin family protein [Candidatus Micrarchaeota archaeon]|nr:slipin family protein [Candidatus Micrarchaeota archaeon]
MILEFVLVAIAILFFLSIKVLDQWEQGIILTLGKYSSTRGAGVTFVIPIIQQLIKVDMRIVTIDVPKQEVITKDNVPLHVNAVVYFKVRQPEKAVIVIQNYHYAVSQYAQTALRDIIGNIELDQVLTDREKIGLEIKELVDRETDAWGIDVTAIKMQDIELPSDMKRAMARQAEAEREKRATITLSTGEVAASQNLAKAAQNLAGSPGALHLRTLQTITDISPDASNKIIIVTPLEILEGFKSLAGVFQKPKEK